MVVPTLPVIGHPPHLELFKVLEALIITLVYVYITVATVFTNVLVYSLVLQTYYSRRTSNQCRPCGCCSYMKAKFLSFGRLLCVHTFPALFKKHKTRCGHGGETREFMLFLDRKVENNLALVAAFYSIVFSIFCSSTMVFFRYFPVEESAECLEKDKHDRSLFCYSNASLPVDCTKYSVTELREIEFECYTIALPVGISIAVAAALGLAKVAIVCITAYVKLTEEVVKMTRNPQRPPRRCCCRELPRTLTVYVKSSYVLLGIMSLVSIAWSIYILWHFFATGMKQPLHLMYYSAYTLLPILVCVPLTYITWNMKAHCDRGEYISFSADQRPLHPCDWDEEWRGAIIYTVATDENDETLQIIEHIHNPEYTNYGTNNSTITGQAAM